VTRTVSFGAQQSNRLFGTRNATVRRGRASFEPPDSRRVVQRDIEQRRCESTIEYHPALVPASGQHPCEWDNDLVDAESVMISDRHSRYIPHYPDTVSSAFVVLPLRDSS
jgi:hypothetical protein